MNRFLTTLFLSLLAVSSGFAEKVTPESLKTVEAKIQKLSREVLPATVSLIPGGPARRMGTGTGVVVNEDGLILTAAHVAVELGSVVNVIFPNGDRARAKILGMDFSRDAAMIQITDKGKYPFVEIGESKDLVRNAWCIALGHAGGYQADRTPPVRLGRVIRNKEDEFLVTDSALIGGDSGGPLFDINGKLIGIHSNIGFSLSENRHVPISVFHENWDRLKKGERYGGDHLGGFLENPDRPVLGAVLTDADDEGGALVEEIVPSSPAKKAGLKEGDRIVKADDLEVKNAESLMGMLSKKYPGDQVRMTVESEDGDRGVSVKLVAAKDLRGWSRSKPKRRTRERPDDGEDDDENDDKADSKPLSKEEQEALWERFDKRMSKAIEEGKLNLELDEIEEFGGPRNFGKLMQRFEESLTDRQHEKLAKLLSTPEPLNPEDFDPDEKVEVGEEFFREVLDAFYPSVSTASEATHPVFIGTEWKSLCTVVHEDGYALAKASELETTNNQKLNVLIRKGKLIPAKVIKSFEEQDLVLIKLKSKEKFSAVTFHNPKTELPLGSLIAAAGPGPDALAIGVVSVLPRTLAGAKKGFLGIATDFHSKGVKVQMVLPNGSAAKSGVRAGDIITKIDSTICDTPEKLIKVVSGTPPGDTIRLHYLRNDKAGSREIKLGDRGEQDDGRGDPNGRMNKFGTEVSKRSSGYEKALQTDLPISPQLCGGPLVDLAGNVIGLNIARAGRIKTYALPASEILPVLDAELKKIAIAKEKRAKQAAAERKAKTEAAKTE